MLSTVFGLVLQGLLRLRVEGPVPVSGAGPLLYVIAHRARLDSVLAGLFLPHRPLAVLPAEEVRSLMDAAAVAMASRTPSWT